MIREDRHIGRHEPVLLVGIAELADFARLSLHEQHDFPGHSGGNRRAAVDALPDAMEVRRGQSLVPVRRSQRPFGITGSDYQVVMLNKPFDFIDGIARQREADRLVVLRAVQEIVPVVRLAAPDRLRLLRGSPEEKTLLEEGNRARIAVDF